MGEIRKNRDKKITRKDFLKASAITVGASILPRNLGQALGDFPGAERLGRITELVDIKSAPDFEAATVGRFYEDNVIPWRREVIGRWPWRNVQRWVETDEGYVWAPKVQPVKNELNTPLSMLPTAPDGKAGMWVEVTVPWVNAVFETPSIYSTWWTLQEYKNLPPRYYYSQILWVDQVRTGTDGNLWYRINERYGNPGDLLWAPAEAFRPLTEAELAPISPDIEDKQIVIDVTSSRQTLSCYEDGREVYFCRISSGTSPYTTPLSSSDSPGFNIWRKLHSIQMSGGTNEAGWMIPGIGWTALFLEGGIAIHSTFWHNNFGEPSSHGCVNAAPEDAKWVFRWSHPNTPFQEGDIKVSGKIGTPVKIIEY